MGKNDFTANSSPTIIPLQLNVKIGQRYFLSSIDIAAVRMFYSCSGVGTTLPPPTIPTTTRKYHPEQALVAKDHCTEYDRSYLKCFTNSFIHSIQKVHMNSLLVFDR